MSKKVFLMTGASFGMGKENLKNLDGHPLQMDVTKDSEIQNVVDTII